MLTYIPSSKMYVNYRYISKMSLNKLLKEPHWNEVHDFCLWPIKTARFVFARSAPLAKLPRKNYPRNDLQWTLGAQCLFYSITSCFWRKMMKSALVRNWMALLTCSSWDYVHYTSLGLPTFSDQIQILYSKPIRNYLISHWMGIASCSSCGIVRSVIETTTTIDIRVLELRQHLDERSVGHLRVRWRDLIDLISWANAQDCFQLDIENSEIYAEEEPAASYNILEDQYKIKRMQ